MSKKFLLIDTYLNETRVALVKESVLEDFDDEFSSTKLKKGNIYIGRIMRIEPSLQAAFVDFGFEKHGFLAFSEIRPNDGPSLGGAIQSDDPLTDPSAMISSQEIPDAEEEERPLRPIASIGKIQDLLKRQQLVMVQVIKDPRGSKGAALTTYLSFPGRYCFLLPNTPKSSGISKKITDADERKALKTILTTLEMPDGASVILRSASMGKKKSEIKRDYDYLMKLWEKIAHHPMDNVGLIYEEHDLLIRSLRDLYSSDIDEVFIQGDEAFKRAKSYIRSVFPSHIKKIKQHTEPIGLFEKFKIESQIETIYDHTVTLPSGGSIVINPTEALVSIDVNSSKSTQGRSIEDTALKTNLEATAAIARNLRLRDLAGLIVIDFIDLHPNKRAAVEKALKDALSMDRARLKIGKISEFGLLEMSRQRLRQSLMESNTLPCSSCQGSGRVLSLSMQSMGALRAIERTISIPTCPETIHVSGSEEVVLCLLNDHRKFLCDIEKKYNKTIHIRVNKDLDALSLVITPDLLAQSAAVEMATINAIKKGKKPSKVKEPLQKSTTPEPANTSVVIQNSAPTSQKRKIKNRPKEQILDSDLGGTILLPVSGKHHRKKKTPATVDKKASPHTTMSPSLYVEPDENPALTSADESRTTISKLAAPDVMTKKRNRTRKRSKNGETSNRSLTTTPTSDFDIVTLGTSKAIALEACAENSIAIQSHTPSTAFPNQNAVDGPEIGPSSDGPIQESRRARLRKRRQARAAEQVKKSVPEMPENGDWMPILQSSVSLAPLHIDVLPDADQVKKPKKEPTVPKKSKKISGDQISKNKDVSSSIVLLPRRKTHS